MQANATTIPRTTKITRVPMMRVLVLVPPLELLSLCATFSTSGAFLDAKKSHNSNANLKHGSVLVIEIMKIC